MTDPDSKWLHWLAEIGYGIDWSHDPHPPCTRRELAEVMNEIEPLDEDALDSETGVDIWEWVIDTNTGWDS